MKIEHVFHCELVECNTHIRTASAAPSCGLLVTELPWSGVQDQDSRWFCSWECVMRFAAAMPPAELIGSDG